MSEVKIQFIGSGDAFGSGGKLNTCFFVSAPNSNFLIDCGASSLLGLKKAGINPNEIGTIFISHFHGDHFGGLPFLILDAHLVQKRSLPLTIVGPLGLEKRVHLVMEALFKGSTSISLDFEMKFIEVPDFEKREVDSISVVYYPVVHSPESNPHGLKVEISDKIIAYSGDSEWTESLIDLSRGSDLFIVECFNFKGNLKYHMNYDLLVQNKGMIESRKIMLTHLGQDMLSRIDDLEFEVCQDGQTLTL